MNDDIGLAILEELRKQNEILYKQNEMLHFQAKVLNKIYGKNSENNATLRLMLLLFMNVHDDIDFADIWLGDKKDSENE